MYNYNNLSKGFLQYKNYLGYSYKTDAIVLKEIITFLEENKIDKITKEIVEKYARLNPNIKQNTLVRNIGVFREFNKYLKLQDIECYQIPSKIYAKKEQNFVAYTFTYDEIKRIYSNLNFIKLGYCYSYYSQVSYPLIIKLLYQTGMRVGELLNIKISDYKIDYFLLRKTKNNQERTIMIPASLRDDLLRFHIKFHNMENDLFFRLSVNSVEKYFKKVLRLSNITITNNGPRIHDLRHTFIVHSIEKARRQGKDLNVYFPILQAHTGHKCIKSLAYYFHINQDVLYELKNISEENLSYLIPEVKDGDFYE